MKKKFGRINREDEFVQIINGQKFVYCITIIDNIVYGLSDYMEYRAKCNAIKNNWKEDDDN